MPIHICSQNCQFILQPETDTYLCEESQYVHICGDQCTTRIWDVEQNCWKCRLRNSVLQRKEPSNTNEHSRVSIARNRVLSFSSTTTRLVPILLSDTKMRPYVIDTVNLAYSRILSKQTCLATLNNTYLMIGILYSMADARHDGLIPAIPELKSLLPKLSSLDRFKIKENGFRMKHITQVMRRLQAICTPESELLQHNGSTGMSTPLLRRPSSPHLPSVDPP